MNAHRRHADRVRRDTFITQTHCGGILGLDCTTTVQTIKSTPTSPPAQPPPSSPPTQASPSQKPPSAPANTPQTSPSTTPSTSSQVVDSVSKTSASASRSTASKTSSQSATLSDTIVLGGGGSLSSQPPTNYLYPTDTFGDASASSSTTSPTVAPSANSDASNPRTSAIVGGILASLAGLAVIAFIGMYILRRYRNKKDDEDNDAAFAETYKRDSAMLDSEFTSPQNDYGYGAPRPPTMIERHVQNEYDDGQQNLAGTVFKGARNNVYAEQHPYHADAPFQSVGASPTAEYYDTGIPGEFSVQEYSQSEYTNLERSSVTPYQAAQYAAINQALQHNPEAPIQENYEAEQQAYEQHYNEQQHYPQHNYDSYQETMAGSRSPAPTYHTEQQDAYSIPAMPPPSASQYPSRSRSGRSQKGAVDNYAPNGVAYGY